MGSPTQKGSLFAEVNLRQSRNAWDMLGKPKPLSYTANPEAFIPDRENVDVNATNEYLKGLIEGALEPDQVEETVINYKAIVVGLTLPVGVGRIRFDFEIESKDKKSLSTFSGSVNTFNFGIGTDIGGTVSTGSLTGPRIPWHKSAVLKALNGKTVTGDGITFAIFNGLTFGADLKIGEYVDPTFAYPVEGIGIGWEGFRGALKIDENSFKIIANKK